MIENPTWNSIAALWRIHAERCSCRSSDGQRCGLARAIKALSSAMKDVEAHLRHAR